MLGWFRIGVRRYAAQWFLLGSALIILSAVIGWNLYSEYRSTDAIESERVTTQAKVINENLGRQLVATNLALDSIRRDFPTLAVQEDARLLISRRLQEIREAMPRLRAITTFDAEVMLAARSPDQFVGQNFSKREYCRLARDGGDPAKLYVSPPFQAATGEYVINMVKVLSNAHGAFNGALLASLDPSYFSVLLDSVRYAPDMLASLAHGDGLM